MLKTVIFGATGHMGQAVARQLVSEGRTVHLVARDAAALTEIAAELQASCSLFELADPDTISKAVNDASTDGALAGLVWAVGSILLKPLTRLSVFDFQDTYNTNVIGAALAAQAAQQSLKAGKGSIVFFSSVAATQGFTNHAAISSAKAAVEGLARALAAELAPDVRVNVIAPSLSQSKMAEPLLANEAMAKGLAQMHPLGRLGQASDFSGLVSLLLDNEKSGWMTGAIIPVDGGRGTLAVNAKGR
jgi:NAD(P)-dependent dehydrogenase (short-subunit alcohol dehydrogenase family)